MSSTAKPLVLARPFRTGFYFGLGTIAASFVVALLAWIVSFVLGFGLLGLTALGGGETYEIHEGIERERP